MPIEALTPAQLLLLGRWLSPAYPVGGFAYSHGLEEAALAGRVGPGALEGWLCDLAEHGAGRVDCILIAAAWRAVEAGEVARIDAAARAFAGSAERLLETAAQGAAFARVTAATRGLDLSALAYPVALGRAASLEGMPLAPVQVLHLQAWLSTLIACAQRLMPLGQTEGQRILDALAPRLPAIAAGAAAGDLDDLATSCFVSDVAAMRHETLPSRIFRS